MCLILCGLTGIVLYAESALPKQQGFLEKLNPFWSFLWSGFWEYEEAMINRGDLRIHIPWQSLSLRVQLIDKRPVPPWEELDTGNTAFSGGLYHKQTGSRLLYGILNERGLADRLRSPWSRSIPFAENHKPSGSDLKTEASSAKEPGAYLYLGTPQLGIFKGFASVLLDSGYNPGFTSGVQLRFKPKTNLRLEGFYTGKTLPPYTPTAWFSESPPLPERDFHLYALNMVYTSPFLGIAADWAYSDTFGYGRDMYGNLGIRIGNRPWQLSLAADGAGDRYAGSDGSPAGAGFRLGAQLENYGKKNRLFRFSTNFRAPGIGEPFERSSTLIYYRFPSDFGNIPVKPSRISLTLARNASYWEKIEDKIEGVIGINWGHLRSVFSGTVTGISSATEQPIFFPIPEDSLSFSSAKVSGELSYYISIFRFKIKLGYTVKKDKEPLWDTAFHTAIYGKPGNLNIKIASPDFPTVWTYTVAWQLRKN